MARLEPVRTAYERLRRNDAELLDIMKSGAAKAERLARRTLEKVYKKIGFVR